MNYLFYKLVKPKVSPLVVIKEALIINIQEHKMHQKVDKN